MKDEATPEQIAMARRIAANECAAASWKRAIALGEMDDWHGVKIALAAIIETEALLNERGHARTASEQPASGEVALREALEAIVTRSNNDRIGTAKVIDMRNIASAALFTTSEAPAQEDQQ